MGLTKRKDSWYVEFPVLDDGDSLELASGGGGQLKRWKVGSLNKTAAKQQEAILKTKLLTGEIPSPGKARAQSVTFRKWAKQYLNLEPVKRLRGYAIRKLYVENLVRFFGDKPLGTITPEHVTAYRAQRVQDKRVRCTQCQAMVTREACGCWCACFDTDNQSRSHDVDSHAQRGAQSAVPAHDRQSGGSCAEA